jgi:sugar/nucleoside kinase (ribokinase family)
MKTAKKNWDVVVVGDFFMDVVMSGFYAFPRLGEENFAHALKQEIGGGAAITSCGLARLGMNVAVLGVVGKEDGMWLVKRLIAAGVNASALVHHPDLPSGVTVSVSTAEDRAYYTYYGANEHLPNLLKEPEARACMANARHVHFACAPDPELDAGLIPELHARGCSVSIDVGWHESWLADPRNYETLRESDVFFPNEREAQLMTGETEPEAMLRMLRARGVRNIALKLGARGAMLLWESELICCPPYPVTPLDTTGAGDCFDAGFIFGWLRGLPAAERLRTASVCGAMSTRALGGIAAFPSSEELEEALEGVAH